MNGAIQFGLDNSYHLTPVLVDGMIVLDDYNGHGLFTIPSWEGKTKSLNLTAISEDAVLDFISIIEPLGFFSEIIDFSDRGDVKVPIGTLRTIGSNGEPTGIETSCAFTMDGVNVLAGPTGDNNYNPLFKAASDVPLGFDTIGNNYSPAQLGFEDTPLIRCSIGRHEDDLAWGLKVEYGPTDMDFIRFETPNGQDIFVDNYLGEVLWPEL